MPEITDATLLKYNDGEASDLEAEMIEASEEWYSRANQLADEQKRWSSQMSRVECPDTMTLGEYHLQLLPQREKSKIDVHITDCPLCTKELAEMGTFVGETPKAKLKEVLETGKQILAELVEKPLGEPGMQTRGVGTGTRLYMADDLQLSLSVQPDMHDERVHSITGLAMGRETAGMVAHLVHEGESIQIAEVDDLGNFHFGEVQEGLFDIFISGEGVGVKIRFIQI